MRNRFWTIAISCALPLMLHSAVARASIFDALGEKLSFKRCLRLLTDSKIESSLPNRFLAKSLSHYLSAIGARYTGAHAAGFLRLQRAISDMVGPSDMNPLFASLYNGETMLVVIFTRELSELSQSEEALDYLRACVDFLRPIQNNKKTSSSHTESPSAGVHDKKLSLWDFTLKQAGGDRSKALKWMGVLFQDVKMTAHVTWLEENFPDRVEFAEKLKLVNDAIREGSAESLSLYPDAASSIERRAIYHYYVPAYLAVRLREMGHPSGPAAAAPFLFNTVYEANSLRINQAFGEGKTRLDLAKAAARVFWPKIEPYPYGALEDLGDEFYLGLAGARDGAGLPPQAKSPQDVILPFSQNPEKYILDQLRTLW